MKHQESTLQTACVRWFRCQYPQLVIYAVPNGGSRNVLEAQRLKAEGVLAGVADLVVLLPQGKSLYIEMKVKGNRQTQNQKDFQNKVIALGHTYAVCYTFEEFQKVIEKSTAKPARNIILEHIRQSVEISTGEPLKSSPQYLKVFCGIAKKHYNATNKEIAKYLQKSLSSISYYVKQNSQLTDSKGYKLLFKDIENSFLERCK